MYRGLKSNFVLPPCPLPPCPLPPDPSNDTSEALPPAGRALRALRALALRQRCARLSLRAADLFLAHGVASPGHQRVLVAPADQPPALWTKTERAPTERPKGYGSKSNHQGTADFSPWHHLPRCHFGVTPCLTHSQMGHLGGDQRVR